MAGVMKRRSGARAVDVWVAIGGAVITACCVVMVWGGSLSGTEQSVFLWINGLADWLEMPLWLIQLAGSLGFVLLAGLAALLLRRVRLAVGIAIAVPAKLAMEWVVIKPLVERERPSVTIAGAVVREENTSRLGFPSGHAILVFLLATIVAPYVPRRVRWPLFVIAAVAGFARVYLAAHNPLDVVAGAGLGLAFGSLWNLLAGVPSDARQPAEQGPPAANNRD